MPRLFAICLLLCPTLHATSLATPWYYQSKSIGLFSLTANYVVLDAILIMAYILRIIALIGYFKFTPKISKSLSGISFCLLAIGISYGIISCITFLALAPGTDGDIEMYRQLFGCILIPACSVLTYSFIVFLERILFLFPTKNLDSGRRI